MTQLHYECPNIDMSQFEGKIGRGETRDIYENPTDQENGIPPVCTLKVTFMLSNIDKERMKKYKKITTSLLL